MLFLLIFLTTAISQWRLAPGSEGVLVSDIDIYEKYPDTIYAIGTARNDSLHGLLSTDGGITWTRVMMPAGGRGAIKIDIKDSKTQYASFNSPSPGGNAVGRTTDSWKTLDVLFVGYSYPTPIIERDPHNKQTYYVGVGPTYLYRSSDNFQTSEIIFRDSPINSLTIDPFDDSILYLGTRNGLWKSTDDGTTWTKLWLGFDARLVTSIIVHPLNNNILYASVYGRDTVSYIGGVFKSTGQGETWWGINNGLSPSDRDINFLAINYKNPKELFVGTSDFEVYNRILLRTTNGGDLWEDYSEGLPSRIESILVDTVHNRILTGTNFGIYTIDLLSGVKDNVLSLANDFVLFQNYPNPFNEQTIIKFFAPQSGRYQLKLYSVLGQLIAILYENNLFKGYNQVTFDGSNLSSGIYFYRLISPTNSHMIKRMILIK